VAAHAVYQSVSGLIIVDGDGVRVQAFAHCTTRRSADTGDYIARCACFRLAGQGASPSEARRSLEAVLANHLDLYQKAGRLGDVVTAPDWHQSDADTHDLLLDLREHGPIVRVDLRAAA